MHGVCGDMAALTGKEVLWVVGIQKGTYAAVTEQTTTGDIANLGGGGGLKNEIDVTSGSTATATLGSIVMFNSASGAPKTINAPTATGSLQIIEACDVFGDAFLNPITFVPATGSVVGNQAQIYTQNGSARWRDTTYGWCNV